MKSGDRVIKTGSPNDYTTGRTGVIVEGRQIDGPNKVCVKWDENGRETWCPANEYRGVVLESEYPKWEKLIESRRVSKNRRIVIPNP